MEAWIEKFGWKKFVTIVIVICLLFLGFVILSFINQDKQQTAVVKKNIEKTNQQERNSGTGGYGGGVADAPLKPYITSDYQLQYPKNLSVKNITPVAGATSSVQFTDVNLNTNIQIDVFQKPQNSYEDAIKPYVLHTDDVEKLPLHFDDNAEFFLDSPENPMVHKTLIFVDKKDKYFRISFDYSGSELDIDTERNFARLMTSLK